MSVAPAMAEFAFANPYMKPAAGGMGGMGGASGDGSDDGVRVKNFAPPFASGVRERMAIIGWSNSGAMN
jgi:hypothetical protein